VFLGEPGPSGTRGARFYAPQLAGVSR
jgi:hypothetical protein